MKTKAAQLQDELVQQVEATIDKYKFPQKDIENVLSMTSWIFRESFKQHPRDIPPSIHVIELLESFLRIIETVRAYECEYRGKQ